VQTVTPDTPLLEAAGLMVLWHIRRLPVVEGGKLVGIVSQGDVYQSIFKVHLHMQSDTQD
jgi:CBS domain-containing protein